MFCDSIYYSVGDVSWFGVRNVPKGSIVEFVQFQGLRLKIFISNKTKYILIDSGIHLNLYTLDGSQAEKVKDFLNIAFSAEKPRLGQQFKRWITCEDCQYAHTKLNIFKTTIEPFLIICF